MRGRRREDMVFGQVPHDPQPGDIWKYVSKVDGQPISARDLYPPDRVPTVNGNLTDTVWGYVAPTGGIGTLSIHTVREHDDGTVSVRPGDGSSNSILHGGGPDGRTWHGYIEHNEWREV